MDTHIVRGSWVALINSSVVQRAAAAERSRVIGSTTPNCPVCANERVLEVFNTELQIALLLSTFNGKLSIATYADHNGGESCLPPPAPNAFQHMCGDIPTMVHMESPAGPISFSATSGINSNLRRGHSHYVILATTSPKPSPSGSLPVGVIDMFATQRNDYYTMVSSHIDKCKASLTDERLLEPIDLPMGLLFGVLQGACNFWHPLESMCGYLEIVVARLLTKFRKLLDGQKEKNLALGVVVAEEIMILAKSMSATVEGTGHEYPALTRLVNHGGLVLCSKWTVKKTASQKQIAFTNEFNDFKFHRFGEPTPGAEEEVKNAVNGRYFMGSDFHQLAHGLSRHFSCILRLQMAAHIFPDKIQHFDSTEIARLKMNHHPMLPVEVDAIALHHAALWKISDEALQDAIKTGPVKIPNKYDPLLSQTPEPIHPPLPVSVSVVCLVAGP